MPTASSLAWKTPLSEKSDAVGIAADWRAWRFHWRLIVVISVRATDRCSNIWALPPGAGYCVRYKGLTAWLQNSKKRAERSEIDVWAESPRLFRLVICIIVCLSWAVNHYRDNAITLQSPARQKNARELEAGERGNYRYADASAWCCCAWCSKYTKELADAKAGNDALRDDAAAGRRRLHYQSSPSVSAWSHRCLRRG